MYDELVNALRETDFSDGCPCGAEPLCKDKDCVILQAADAIEELRRVAKAMHTWIFLNTGDEQSVYDECGLSDEMNVALGYGGQFILEPPKGEGEDDAVD